MKVAEYKNTSYRISLKLIFLVSLFSFSFAFVDSTMGKPQMIPEWSTEYINWIMFVATAALCVYETLHLAKNRKTPKSLLPKPHRYNLLKITGFLFSIKTQKEIFEQTMTDWNFELYKALEKEEIWKSRWINVSCTCSFLITILQKSPIGDLTEFIRSFWK